LLKRNVGPGPTTVGQYNTRTDYVKKTFIRNFPASRCHDNAVGLCASFIETVNCPPKPLIDVKNRCHICFVTRFMLSLSEISQFLFLQ